MKRLFNWLAGRRSPTKASPRLDMTRTGAHLRPTGSTVGHQPATPRQASPRQRPDLVELDPHIKGQIEDSGPGKNVLIRNRFRREDAGTHDTLMILDDSVVDNAEETGIDPYNTGQFDRSKNWDKRFRN